MQKLAINLLIGPAPEPYLLNVLQSLSWVDEVVIVSSSKTVFWLKSKGKFPNVKVVEYFDFFKEFNFSDARNLAKDFTTSDWILKVDADEIYPDDAEEKIRKIINDPVADCYSVEFWHFMRDIFNYQFIQPQEVLFRNIPRIRWGLGVHEGLQGVESRAAVPVRYFHLGYIKPQREVWERWKLYDKIGGTKCAEVSDPDHILDDREVTPFTGEYPSALRDFVDAERARLCE